MITVEVQGDWSDTEKWLAAMHNQEQFKRLQGFGAQGVAALASATPVDSGLSATSWFYKITQKPGYYSIAWHNSHMAGGTPVVILLQYGHGTRNGGYVQGHDFIMPAIRPVMDQIGKAMWKEVTK